MRVPLFQDGSDPHAADPRIPFVGHDTFESLRQAAALLPDAVFMTDPHGRITFWNAAAERLSGWTSAEAVGQDCSLLAGDATHGCQCTSGPLKCGLALNGRTSKSCVTRHRSGRPLLIVKNAVVLTNAAGDILGALECFTDASGAARLHPCPVDGAPADAERGHGLLGHDPAMLVLQKLIALVAGSHATVLVLGESGSGKERVAEAIHRQSPRANKPFVKLNCAALNENLLESELFGHVKGSFTGALRDRRGRFEEADGGTLLLDEIGDISPAAQLKLLRVIEQREFERVGDGTPIKVDVRLICATHRDLKALVAAGRFRGDLYFRLAVFPIRVPALREHPLDIPLLAEHHLARVAPGRRITPAARDLLVRHGWPGNVRELQNVVEYAALRAEQDDIAPAHLPDELRGAVPSAPAAAPGKALPPELDDAQALRQTLEKHHWNRTQAAKALGISRVTLWKRLKAHGLADGDEA